MPEPTFLCAAPIMANESQKIALYSHYAAVAVPAIASALMFVRAKTYGKVAHCFGGVALAGVALTALYAQSQYNRFLYHDIESAVPAVMAHASIWALAAVFLFIYATNIPGFFFRRAKGAATIVLCLLAFVGFGLAGTGLSLATGIMTATPAELLKEAAGAGSADLANAVIQGAAMVPALLFALPGIVLLIAAAALFFVFKSGKGKETVQARPAMLAVLVTVFVGLAHGACAFLCASKPEDQGVATAIMMMNFADVIAAVFVLFSSISILGTEKDFPKPVKVLKKTVPVAPASGVPAAQNLAVQQAAMLQYQQMLAAQQAAVGTPPPAQMPPPIVPPGMTPEQYQVLLQQQAYAMAQYQAAQMLAQQQAAAVAATTGGVPVVAPVPQNVPVANSPAPARPAAAGHPVPAGRPAPVRLRHPVVRPGTPPPPVAAPVSPATPEPVARTPRAPRKFVRPTRPPGR